MSKVQLTAVAGALVLALSLSAGASRVEAQDTSAVQPAPADTSAYTGGEGVDTTARPTQPGVTDATGGAMDTTGWRKPAGDTTAPDTTKPGDSTQRTPQDHEPRMHPGGADSAGESDSSGQAAAPGATPSPSSSSSPPSEPAR